MKFLIARGSETGTTGENTDAASPMPDTYPRSNPARPEVHVWKDVRAFLERDVTADDNLNKKVVAPVAICPICLGSELSIQGLPPSSEHADREVAFVLICGHMLCEACLLSWYGACLDRSRGLSCPVCRHSAHYAAPDCRHGIQAYVVPGGGSGRRRRGAGSGSSGGDEEEVSYLAHCPRTLLEGGTQPERCNQCRVRRAEALAREMEREVEDMVHRRLYGLAVSEGDLVALLMGVKLEVRDSIYARLGEIISAEYPSWGGEMPLRLVPYGV